MISLLLHTVIEVLCLSSESRDPSIQIRLFSAILLLNEVSDKLKLHQNPQAHSFTQTNHNIKTHLFASKALSEILGPTLYSTSCVCSLSSDFVRLILKCYLYIFFSYKKCGFFYSRNCKNKNFFLLTYPDRLIFVVIMRNKP